MVDSKIYTQQTNSYHLMTDKDSNAATTALAEALVVRPRLEPLNGAVLLLDALGMREVWARSNPEEIVIGWTSVVTEFQNLNQDLLKTFYEEEQPIFPGPKPTVRAFSDTIIATMGGEEGSGVIGVLGSYLFAPFCSAIKRGIFLRGAISFGKFYQSEHITIGPAVDEALEWYQRADWMGVMLTPSAQFRIESSSEGDTVDKLCRFAYVPYSIPIHGQKGRLEFWNGRALTWPRFWALHKDTIGGDGKTLRAHFSTWPIGFEAASKYSNTIAFYDHCTQTMKTTSPPST